MGHDSRSKHHLPNRSNLGQKRLSSENRSHKTVCWREKAPSASLALWLYASPHCPSYSVSPGILTLWRGFGSCCENLLSTWRCPSPDSDWGVCCLCFAHCKGRFFMPTLNTAACNTKHGAAPSQELQRAKPELLMINSRFCSLGHWKPCFQFCLDLQCSASHTRVSLHCKQKARISVCLSARSLRAFQPALSNECLRSQNPEINKKTNSQNVPVND